MTDLISRSAVIDRIAEFLGPKGLDEWEVMVAIREIIENAPTLDVVPVVRCKDCRYAFQNNGHEKEGCPIMDKRVWMNGNSFCSEGARMDGKEEETDETD